VDSYFSIITEDNKLNLNKPVDTDRVYYSELNEWHTNNAFRSFSLKYVIDKCIYYKSGKKEYAVHAGDFLLACRQPDVKAYFDSQNPVKSICIDIRPETVEEAYNVMTADGIDFDNFLSGYLKQPHFFETVCPVHSNISFSTQLHELVLAIQNNRAGELVNKEWFLNLTEKIIHHEYGHYRAINNLAALKTETKKELLKRLLKAKQYIDEQYLFIKDITEVAAYCNLSEFHFFRSFRQAFGNSPYQYILKKRLQEAVIMIHENKFSITAIAHHCNFPDLPTFSKAFKRQFGYSPSRFLPTGYQ
jgi:AraC family transcriptional regulator